MESPRLPLSGIRVIDFCHARAGPTCVRHLSDWGADVIKAEPPNWSNEDITGRRDDFDFQNLHRGKRILQLDLKTPEGHAVFMRLVKTADVLVENMRSSVKYRLKISWEDASPLTFSDLPKAIRLPTPDPGQHTGEIMSELGYTHLEIAQLRNSNVLR